MVKYFFGDVVKEVKDKVDRANNPYEFFIAGDHMDTDELHLLRRGTFKGKDVGPAFIHIFKPGQVLYGSRRTYLRKVAVADFEGITANTTFVLESKNEKILLQRLLPFIMQSERFVEFSIKKSKGSTNPYILFSDLANYKVELPSMEEQIRIANILWSIDTVKMSYKHLISVTDEMVKSRFIEMFGDPVVNPRGLKKVLLAELSELITKGASPNWQGFSYTEDVTQTIFVTSENVREGFLDLSNPKYIEDSFNEKQRRSLLRKGDFLINIVGASIGRAAQYNSTKKANINQAVALVRIKPSIIRDNYLIYYLNSDKAQRMYDSMKSDTGRANLSLQDISNLEILLPNLREQTEFDSFMRKVDKSKFVIQYGINVLATILRIISYNLIESE